MKFYLSSYKLGNETEKLKKLIPEGGKIGFIPNALDYVDVEARNQSNEKAIQSLTDLGIVVEMLDLKDYFGNPQNLRDKLNKLEGVFVRGGNTFILRQAMKLSGFDLLIKEIIESKRDFLYSGYSAGICVLAPSLEALKIVDDPMIFPYKEYGQDSAILEGLGILDYMILPHYQSDHPESSFIDEEVEYYKKNKIPFKPLRDGEVIIIE